MLHTAHHAIETRLTRWKTFFETGIDGTPRHATHAEHGLDSLVDLAREGCNAHLYDLADVCELMGLNYIQQENTRIAGILLSEDDEVTYAPRHGLPVVTVEELYAALTGH